MVCSRLKKLEEESIKFLKSIPQISKKPLMMWSTGKDSTCVLHLLRKIYGRVPYPVLHIDTGKKFREIYEFRNKLTWEWGLNLIIRRNEEAIKLDISPKTVSHFNCCTELKTNVLKGMIREGFDIIILSIRHDEHYVRGMEDLLSTRDEQGNWKYKAKFGGFGLKTSKEKGLSHLRCHPILPWKEEDVWEYTEKENIPVNPLYFSMRGQRYRSLGCDCCTKPVSSFAYKLRDIVKEIKGQPLMERVGRMQDKEDKDTMLRLRALGYM